MSQNDTVVTIDATSPKKVTIVTEKEMPGSRPTRPKLGHRRTTDGFGHEMDEDHLPPVARFFAGLMENEITRYAIYILPVAAILAIPLTLFCTIWNDKKLGHVDVKGICIWIELVWAFLWIAKILATIIPFLFQAVTGMITTGLRKYALILRAVKTPMSIFLWAVLCIASWSVVYTFNKEWHDKNKGHVEWLSTFHKVLKVSVGMAALWLAEKMLVQLISVQYHARQHHDKIKDIKKTSRAVDLLYDASRRVYPDHHPLVIEEDYDIHDAENVRKLLRQHSADQRTMKLVGELRWTADKVTTAFGRIASDITGQEVMRPTATHTIVEQALERKAGAAALARRIFMALCPQGSDSISEADLIRELGPGREFEASWVFAQLDQDCNGDVSLDEMLLLIGGISQRRKDMWKSACNIKDAIKTLDAVLSFVVFIIVCLFYAAFFSTFLQTNAYTIWSFFVGSGLALSQTINEFGTCCILVFIKHPFDIGDRVNILGVEYEVAKISLLYTEFRRIDTNTLVSVANVTIAPLWIDNVSRSKAMKERYTFSVSSGTSFDDIESLRRELEEFVRQPENSRHFQSEIDIQLLSVGDLKQLDLRVEILHKSNWSNERLRSDRRSRFMSALLSAMRKVPIDGPAGSGPAAGSINNPNYSVSITDADAKASRAHFDADKEAKRLVSKNEHNTLHVAGVSSGLEILKSLSNRKGSVVVEGGASPRPSTSGPNPFAAQWTRVSLDNRPTNYPVRPAQG